MMPTSSIGSCKLDILVLIAILRKGSEEQMVTVGSSWQGISVSNITASGVEIIEGGSSRWLKIE